ncbi:MULTISPECIES: ABC transporter permease [Pseudomonas]|uniref:Transport permease protein n=1 Tax=Pseudomonas nitroreducens TaxID=46680 RepID=A0A6G6IPC7_PSENT|nr:MULTISPECIES: ABC transporter permease [Pseudomonas]MBG6290089.1 ABC transporter permease [Pseudomonas nitroreducens]MDG9852372.1 ABC transporter permease [Pseudomonas nitroreducens]NMZ59951.1 ABC transporter permease [Pseudomonas nitroreducens]NMZ76374.1 ABC transporter permease [Pseudomonas nitroreducens]NNN23292.1 ABC transporter permease [Pseudomonas nitroreducens]
MLGSLWAFRGFVISSIRREFQARYRNSLLGALWTVLNPLAMILVYTLVFSQLMRSRLPGVDNHLAYGFYLCAGFLVWGLFTEITGRSQSMFLDNANLIKKLSFPRICLPTVVIGTALVNFAITFVLFLLIISAAGAFPGPALLALLPLLAIMLAFAAGLGMLLGVLNVFFRDVGQLFGIVVQFWFWLTPIVYPIAILPSYIRPLVEINPMTPLVGAFQTVLVYQRWPDWASLWSPLLISILLCGVGLLLFRARSGEMVDEL